MDTACFCRSGERAERRRWREEGGERVAAVEILRANSEQEISGTATGERAERCQWQKKRGERVAAVDRCQGAMTPKTDVGHRNRVI